MNWSGHRCIGVTQKTGRCMVQYAKCVMSHHYAIVHAARLQTWPDKSLVPHMQQGIHAMTCRQYWTLQETAQWLLCCLCLLQYAVLFLFISLHALLGAVSSQRSTSSGLWRGTAVTLVRDWPSFGVYFAVYEGMQEVLSPGSRQSHNIHPIALLTAGAPFASSAEHCCYTGIAPYPALASHTALQSTVCSAHCHYSAGMHCFALFSHAFCGFLSMDVLESQRLLSMDMMSPESAWFATTQNGSTTISA